MAELFPPTAANEVIGCAANLTPQRDDRDYRTSVTYSCTDPFVILSASLVWRKDGANQDVTDRDNNPALEKVTVSGADAAHFVAAQGRLMAAKGKYLLSIQLVPGERDAIFGVAQKILAQL